MKPTLGELFGEPIPAYFVLLLTGFAAAIGLGMRWAAQNGLRPHVVLDLGLLSLVAGVIGARILHVFVDGYFWDYVHLCTDPARVAWRITAAQCANAEGTWDEAAQVCHPRVGDCFAWAKFWQGGLVWYGGLIAAGFYGIRFLRREAYPVIKTLDMLGMVVPLGLFFGRLGCYLGGCCFGVVSDHAIAVRFPGWSAASQSHFRAGQLPHPGMESLPVLPTQLFEAAGCWVLAAFAMLYLHPRKRFDGQVICVSMAGYALLRFCLEFLRADDRGGALGLSTSQWVGLALAVGVLFAYRHFSARGEGLSHQLQT